MINTILFDMGGTLEDIWYNDQTIHSVTGELRTFLNEHDLGTGCNDITFWNKLNSGIRTYKQWSESNELEKKPEEIWPEYYMADFNLDREKLQERVAKLAGGVAVIKVGAATEVEMKEKKARVEDALHATRAAVEEGVVAGGGGALIRAKQAIKEIKGDNPEQDAGIKIVLRAMEEPMRQIVRNAGDEPSVVVDRVANGKGNFGFNAQTGEYGDMIEMGVLDPTKVTRTALQNAASVASLILTTECMIADMPEDKPAMPPMGMGGGMGGMPGMM